MQEDENQEEGHGDCYEQAIGRIFKVLELAAIGNVGAGLQLYVGVDAAADVFYYGLQVAVTHINGHHHAAVGVFSRYFGGSFGVVDVGQLRKGQQGAVGQGHLQATNVLNVGSTLLVKADRKSVV